MDKNVEVKEGYEQICIWQGCTLGDNPVADFEKWFLDELKVRIQYLEEVETTPDLDSGGVPIADTGGRPDIFFAMNVEDVGKFAIPRLSIDNGAIKWIDDHYDHMDDANNFLYPPRFKKYRG